MRYTLLNRFFSIGACGRLMLDESGTLDLSNATGRCTVSIGRPLDEVIHIKVESSYLNCSKSKSEMFKVYKYILMHIVLYRGVCGLF